jgi:hypothetical protein
MGEVLLRQTTIAIASTLSFLLTMYWWIVVAGLPRCCPNWAA